MGCDLHISDRCCWLDENGYCHFCFFLCGYGCCCDVQEVGPERPKVYLIAKEIVTTEETFVRGLRLLDEVE